MRFHSADMPRAFTVVDLVALPPLGAEEAVSLSRALEEAAAPGAGASSRELPAPIASALVDLRDDRRALEAELAAVRAPTTRAAIREADKREDVAVAALYFVLAAWARLAGELPEGDMAAAAFTRLFGNEGLRFLRLEVKKEWAVVEDKLAIIARDDLEEAIEAIGATAVLDHLRNVHAAYGRVIGTTLVPRPSQSPQLIGKRDLLQASLRTYVLRVAALGERDQPDTIELVDVLLRPLLDWTSARSDLDW